MHFHSGVLVMSVCSRRVSWTCRLTFLRGISIVKLLGYHSQQICQPQKECGKTENCSVLQYIDTSQYLRITTPRFCDISREVVSACILSQLRAVPQNNITGPILEEALASASDKWWEYLMGGGA